jgi:hypothetical protein
VVTPGGVGSLAIPNSISYCTPACQDSNDCRPGQICFQNTCHTPHCTTNDERAPGFCVNDLCCVDFGGPFFVCG